MPPDFSLFYFASDSGGPGSAEKYRLILESAQFADEHGFAAVWTPERHFHAFGGLSPNPVVTAAALAVGTKHVQLRSGSVVLPLHDPIRVVEEWSLVDNLSNGRVGLGVASGWFPDDFILAPGVYGERGDLLFERLDSVRGLWRGESATRENGRGDVVSVTTTPRPVQDDVPVWVTAAGNPETFRRAGEVGANLLTHLLGQTVEEVERKIAIYREARSLAGHAGPGIVSLMLHTFVGTCPEEVRETVRAPMKRYLGSSVNLVSRYVDSLPIFKTEKGLELDDLSESDLDDVLEYSFERYYRSSSLFGTVETCLATVDRLAAIGVDDIACLVDFGLPTDQVLESLTNLDELRRRARETRDVPEVASLVDSANCPTSSSSSDNAEDRIIRIWSELLEVDCVHRDANFFELGGHSLLAVRALHAIEEEFATKIEITNLFRYPTVRTIAGFLGARTEAPAQSTGSRRSTTRAGSRRRQQLKRERGRRRGTGAK